MRVCAWVCGGRCVVGEYLYNRASVGAATPVNLLFGCILVLRATGGFAVPRRVRSGSLLGASGLVSVPRSVGRSRGEGTELLLKDGTQVSRPFP